MPHLRANCILGVASTETASLPELLLDMASRHKGLDCMYPAVRKFVLCFTLRFQSAGLCTRSNRI